MAQDDSKGILSTNSIRTEHRKVCPLCAEELNMFFFFKIFVDNRVELKCCFNLFA